MKLGRIGTLMLVLLAVAIILPMAVISQTNGTYWRNFKMTVPEEIDANPGDVVTINASITNTGRFWLRDFSIVLQGLPSDYNYTITPSHWDELQILRDWNPKDGVFKVPESFMIRIVVPQGASGLHAVTLNGTEHASMYQVSNTTQFVLKVSGVSTPPQLSNFVIPEVVNVNQPFDVSYNITNTGVGQLQGTASLIIPENWTADPQNRSISIGTNGSMIVNFSVTPSSNVGTLTGIFEYPYGNQTLNVTKESISIIPIEMAAPSAGVGSGLGSFFAGLGNYSPLLITIIVVIILVIAWIIWSVYGMYGKKKKPETMKKQVETFPETSPETKL